MRACTGWLLCAAALAPAALSSACTQRPDVVVAQHLTQADAGGSPGANANDSGGNRGSTGNGTRAPDARVPLGPGFGFDAGSPCEQLVSTYEALQYVVDNGCEIPPLSKIFGPVMAFANLYQPNRMGETRAPTYCDLTPGSNPVYYQPPDSGITKLCPVYCDAAMAWLKNPMTRQSYSQCRFGSNP